MATSNTNWTLVDNIPSLQTTISKLHSLPSSSAPPSLYLDIEGVNLCRDGTISIIQIYCVPLDHIFLLDITTLKSAAFTTEVALSDPSGKSELVSIKSLLESPAIPKVFFDIRNDNDALWNLYGVFVQGVIDIQLMEIAVRLATWGNIGPRRRRQFLSGLAVCISKEMAISDAEKMAWKGIKEEGGRIFTPKAGGRFEVFDERPLRREIIEYCVQDVRYLPVLWRSYEGKLCGLGRGGESNWRSKITAETVRRTAHAKDRNYIPNGSHKAHVPEGW